MSKGVLYGLWRMIDVKYLIDWLLDSLINCSRDPLPHVDDLWCLTGTSF